MSKEYRKLMKEIMSTGLFTLEKSGRKTTEKLTNIESGEMYSIHPGDKAVFPLKNWIKKFKKFKK